MKGGYVLCICANMRVVCVRCMTLLCAVGVLNFICVLCVCKLAVAFRAILIVVFFNISFDFNLFSSIFSEVDLIVSRYFKSHFDDLCRFSLEFRPVCLLHRSRHCFITQLLFFYRTIITAFSHNRDGIRFFPKKI
jgi:hypothetical protein